LVLVTDLALQRAGPLLASAGANRLVALWHSGAKKRPLAAGPMGAAVKRLAWAPDDHHLAAGAGSGQATVFTVP
jgi:hypothetical protein